MSYLPIEHHGVVGDLHTAALVGIDGSVDWLCLPYFDSPSLFASILDSAKGGHFRIAAVNPDARRRQMYLPDSNVLVTRFLTPDGVGEVVDFMPVVVGSGMKSVDDHQLIRIVRGVRGSIPFRLECDPAFDYARRRVRPVRTPSGFRYDAASGPPVDLLTTLVCGIEGTAVTADFLLEEGQEIPVVIAQSSGGDRLSGAKLEEHCQESFRTTLRFWQEWIARSRYQGRWREMVKRSALALKLMTFAPTGAIVAAPTTSLPERLGGDRNWDYRYTWIRDSAFTIYAFLRIGFSQEAEAFMGFLERVYAGAGLDGGLGVLYGIDGRREIPEMELDHLEGYRGSRPVRIGNDAARQFQLDINGELLDAIYLYDKYGKPLSHDLWVGVRALANWVCANWERPDEGIWEVRGGRRHFTFSKLMCWVALDRAYRIATRRSLPAERGTWLTQRDAIYESIMKNGYSASKRSFVQSFGSDVLDASLLLAPMLKFVAPSDPRMLGTLDAIDRGLESDHLVRRYDPRMAPDGVGGEEGTFSMCTFWLAEALARAGRLPEARLTFEKMLGYANHVGLYAEQIGLTGEALGNFPQAFTHLGLISAAINISQALDFERSAGRVPRPGAESPDPDRDRAATGGPCPAGSCRARALRRDGLGLGACGPPRQHREVGAARRCGGRLRGSRHARLSLGPGRGDRCGAASGVRCRAFLRAPAARTARLRMAGAAVRSLGARARDRGGHRRDSSAIRTRSIGRSRPSVSLFDRRNRVPSRLRGRAARRVDPRVLRRPRAADARRTRRSLRSAVRRDCPGADRDDARLGTGAPQIRRTAVYTGCRGRLAPHRFLRDGR